MKDTIHSHFLQPEIAVAAVEFCFQWRAIFLKIKNSFQPREHQMLMQLVSNERKITDFFSSLNKVDKDWMTWAEVASLEEKSIVCRSVKAFYISVKNHFFSC